MSRITPTSLIKRALTVGSCRVLIARRNLGNVREVMFNQEVEKLFHESNIGPEYVIDKILPLRRKFRVEGRFGEISPAAMNLLTGAHGFTYVSTSQVAAFYELVTLTDTQYSPLTFDPVPPASNAPDPPDNFATSWTDGGSPPGTLTYGCHYYVTTYDNSQNSIPVGPAEMLTDLSTGPPSYKKVDITFDQVGSIEVYKIWKQRFTYNATTGVKTWVDTAPELEKTTTDYSTDIPYTDADLDSAATESPTTFMPQHVTVETIDQSTQYDEADFEVDFTNGLIKRKTGSAIPDKSTVRCTYYYTKTNTGTLPLKRVTDERYVEVMLIHPFDDGESQMTVTLHKASLITNLSMSSNASDWWDLPFTLECYSDYDNHPDDEFGTIEFEGPLAEYIVEDGNVFASGSEISTYG